MNVTLKLPDELALAAKHLAVDQNKSLSALMSDLLIREVSARAKSAVPRKSLLEAVALADAPVEFYEKEFPLEDRGSNTGHVFSFDDDDG